MAQPRPICISRPSGSNAPVRREVSAYTATADSVTWKAQAWLLCGLAARIAAATAPSGPGVSRQWCHGSNARPLPGSSTPASNTR